MTGFIYAIGDGEGRVKIGWSTDPLRRFNKISSDCPGDVELFGAVEGTREQEGELHSRLKQWRVRREWFRLVGDVAAFVSTLPPPKPKMDRISTRNSNERSIDIPDDAHPLKRFLLQNRITYKAIADAIGITQSAISQICEWQVMPRVPTFMAIRKFTNGAVTFHDFFSNPDAPALKKHRHLLARRRAQ